MGWKCDININEVDLTIYAPVVADDILEKLDRRREGWEYDPVRGYSFRGDVTITEDVVKDGRLTIKFNKVGGSFDCIFQRLTSLEGCPETVGGDFDCSHNRLTTLKGCPKSVGGYFDCGNNQLSSLKGSPKKVGGFFGCNYNQLTSLEGCPESVGGIFYCRENKVEFTEKDVKAVCDVKREIYV